MHRRTFIFGSAIALAVVSLPLELWAGSTEETFVLRDGRTLAFAQYGLSDGTPVIHSNGSGGSRLEWPGDEEMLERLGIRFIAVDRPGHGLSDPQTDRTLLDWPNDIEQLADHLGVDQFYVEGWSAGGAYALAIAHELPDRVIAGAILSGIGPYDRPDPYEGLSEQIATWMENARNQSDAVFEFRAGMAQFLGSMSPAEIGANLGAGSTEDDIAVAQSPHLQELMGANIAEGYRQGFEGPAIDDFVINSPWGFRLEDVQTRFDVWQGAEDENVPLVQGEYQASLLPNSELRVLENTAHLFPLTRWEEILVALTRP